MGQVSHTALCSLPLSPPLPNFLFSYLSGCFINLVASTVLHSATTKLGKSMGSSFPSNFALGARGGGGSVSKAGYIASSLPPPPSAF